MPLMTRDEFSPRARPPSLAEQARADLGNSWLYVFGLERDEPVMRGNQWVRPHRIGISSNPGGVARQGSHWCWWEAGIVAAYCTLGDPMSKQLETEVKRALRSHEIGDADPLHGSWWNVARTELLLSIELCAKRIDIAVWDAEEQAKRVAARKAELLAKLRKSRR